MIYDKIHYIDVRLLVCYASTIIFCNARIWSARMQSAIGYWSSFSDTPGSYSSSHVITVLIRFPFVIFFSLLSLYSQFVCCLLCILSHFRVLSLYLALCLVCQQINNRLIVVIIITIITIRTLLCTLQPSDHSFSRILWHSFESGRTPC
jgi:hypothetical protein